MRSKTAVIILAAQNCGKKRSKVNTSSFVLPDGETLIQNQIRKITLGLSDNIAVITGYQSTKITKQSLGIKVYYNDNYINTLSSSNIIIALREIESDYYIFIENNVIFSNDVLELFKFYKEPILLYNTRENNNIGVISDMNLVRDFSYQVNQKFLNMFSLNKKQRDFILKNAHEYLLDYEVIKMATKIHNIYSFDINNNDAAIIKRLEDILDVNYH